MTLSEYELADIMQRLLVDFDGQASFESVIRAVRDSADPPGHPRDQVEQAARLRLATAAPAGTAPLR